MIQTRIMRMLAGLTLLAMVTAGCGTVTGAAVGTGSGAAIGAGTGSRKGSDGVGAAGRSTTSLARDVDFYAAAHTGEAAL